MFCQYISLCVVEQSEPDIHLERQTEQNKIEKRGEVEGWGKD